jgi:putative phosphonate transport system ATP-binding protein
MILEFEEKVLNVVNLTKRFGQGCEDCKSNKDILIRNFCPVCNTIYACRDISFDLYKGEIIGIVGESGSGKSTVVRCLYLETDVSEGSIFVSGFKEGKVDILNETSQQKRFIKDYLFGMVYQNPYLGLRMKFSSLSNIAEKLIAAGSRNVDTMTKRADSLLDIVKIEDFRRKDTPAEFSGGMQQRVQIAKALSNNPPILFLDEVTTGLDLSVQANVLDLIKHIQRDLSISMIVISHDLGVIRMLSERTFVMLDGKIIEAGLTDQILEDPQHPYTQQLVHSLL